MPGKMLVIDCGSQRVPELSEKLTEVMVEHDVLSMDNVSETVADSYAGVIISGAPILLSEAATKPYLDQFSFIKTYANPVLGICFGHQILGLLHGSIIEKGAERRKPTLIEVEKSSFLFNEIKEELLMQQDHCEEITLPEAFTRLAYSQECAVEAMQHKFKPMYGVQFHPESSGFAGLQLLKNFCKTCR